METINFSKFQAGFSAHFKKAAVDKEHIKIKRVKAGIFTFRPLAVNESLSSVIKIRDISQAQMKQKLPQIFDSISGKPNSKRAFEISGQTAILEFLRH